jgi:hypothetical protein
MLLAVFRKITAFIINIECLSFSGTKVLQCLALRVHGTRQLGVLKMVKAFSNKCCNHHTEPSIINRRDVTGLCEIWHQTTYFSEPITGNFNSKAITSLSMWTEFGGMLFDEASMVTTHNSNFDGNGC